MAIVPIPNIRDLGIVPNNNMDEAEYNAAAESFTGIMPGWGADNKAVGEAGRTNALHAQGAADSANTSATTANQRANDAAASATTASTKASEATTAANAAATSYVSMQKLYLGPKTAPPTVDNQGQPLQLGAWYTNTTNGYWYWWNGANWIVGVGDLNSVDWNTQVINKPPLVNTVNGRTGTVVGLVESDSSAMSESAAMSGAPLGQWATFPGTTAAGADWPSSLFPAYWNVLTFGSATRKTQIAMQVFGGREQSSMFVRSLHDTTWSPWQRFLGDISLLEKSKYVPSPGSAYTANPREATLHYIDISAPCTITVPTSRGAGDQLTLMFSFPTVSSIAFSSNVKAPVGGIRAGVASHILTVTLAARQDGNWQAYDGGLHPW